MVFTGQSMGGATASLATLWMLDKQLQPGKPKSVFSITFGFPLVGDEILTRAVCRKGWEDQLCHVVLGGGAPVRYPPQVTALMVGPAT